MRLLWIHRLSSSDEGGAIYDDKMRAALAGGHEIVAYGLKRNKRARQLVRAAAHASLPEQFGVGGAGDVRAVRDLLGQGFDAAVFSHEHLDSFAAAVRPASAIPFVTIRHNVTSDAMASILADAPALAKFYRSMAERQERAALRGGLFDAIVAVSERDRALLQTLSGRLDIGLALPGAPPAAPLARGAPCVRALAISGTFDWFPKARSLRAFAAAHAGDPLTDARIYASESMPEGIRKSLGAISDAGLAWGDAIRFGLITDRFTAGHKLKTAAYLMNNCIVLSFAPVIHDFTFAANSAHLIHRVQTIADIRAIMNATMARPAGELRKQMRTIKQEVGARLAWESQALALSALIERTRAAHEFRNAAAPA